MIVKNTIFSTPRYVFMETYQGVFFMERSELQDNMTNPNDTKAMHKIGSSRLQEEYLLYI